MDLSEQRAWWDGAAKANAATAVLSNNAAWNASEFYETGVRWFDEVRTFAAAQGVSLTGDRALDFGSGLGRMTAAISDHYLNTVGIDISPEMVKQATENLAHLPRSLTFQVADGYPLEFESGRFDLVFSTIVVQHISAPHNAAYVEEFFRVAAPGGFVLFDAPDHALPGTDSGAGIFLCPRVEVLELASKHNAELVGQRNFPATSTQQWQYLFRKK